MLQKSLNKSERNERVLLDIVERYIQTAEPVSSSELLDTYKYNLSSATVRNIMAILDEAEYLIQPHTSAGRVPTAKAYRFYVDKVQLGSRRPVFQKLNENRTFKTKREKQNMQNEFNEDFRNELKKTPDEIAHTLSQYLAEVTHSMAFAGLLGVNHFYRDGFRNLLDEPEFITPQNIKNLVDYTDSLEHRLDKLYSSIQDDIMVFIGDEQEILKEAPFSLIAFSSELPNEQRAVFGILGPMRMQYTRNLELLDEIRSLFK